MTHDEKGKPGSRELPGVEISKKLVFVNSVSSLLTRLISLSVLVWMHQYLIRRIPTEEYAIYPVIVSVMAFAPIMTTILTGGIARYVVHAYAQHDVRRVSQIVTSMAPLIAAGAIAFWSVGGLAVYFIDSLLSVDPGVHDDAQLMMSLLVFQQGLELLVFPFTIGLYVRQRFVLSNLLSLSEQFVRISLLLVLLLGVAPRVLWVVIAAVVSRMLSLLATLVISQRLMPSLRVRPSLFDRSTARSLTSFGSWTVLGGISYRIRTSANPIILNLLSAPLEVAIFHVGSLPGRQLDSITTLASNPLQPAITAMHAKGDWVGLQRAYLRGNRIALWVMLLPCVPLMVFGSQLAVLYVGDAYRSAGVVLLWICLGFCISQSSEMLYRVALATAQVRGFFIAAISGSLTNVGLTVILVGYFDMGAIGAALASVAIISAWHSLIFWPMGARMVKITFARFWRETLWPAVLPAIVATAVCWVLKRLVAPDTWLQLGLCAAAGIAAYLAVLLLRGLPPEDRRDLERLLNAARNGLSALPVRSRSQRP
jgi:O-antigen/teichoic acid export membrane protein